MLHVIGVNALSLLGRMIYHVKVRDFHCGLRGMTGKAVRLMDLKCDGMEFATEMIGEAARRGLSIGETPVRLRRPSRARRSKLRTFPDGIRHLKYMIKSAFFA